MPLSRRRLLGAFAASAAFSGLARSVQAQADDGAEAETYLNEIQGYGPLIPDPRRLLDLPQGFTYRVISQAFETMSDGFLTPGRPDGMGCFPLEADRVVLLRNHELKVTFVDEGPFGVGARLADRLPRDRAYDYLDTGLPAPGGVTRLVYDLKAQKVVSHNLSLAGTLVNCAGGMTPWGSWISCEETTLTAGLEIGKDHGYAFDVSASATGLVDPVPLKPLGRFKHEAACVDPRTGVIYMTEDLPDGLFYRFLPNDRRQPLAGGRLQALGLLDAPEDGDTRNWEGFRTWSQGDVKSVVWIDLDGVDNPYDDLRLRGARKGAARFARGEGVFFGAGEIFIACTSGGPYDNGQIMRYTPSPREGQADEKNQPGQLQLFVEPSDERVLNYCDNIAVAPWGHLIVCEDKYTDIHVNHLKAVTPQGKVYTLARNVYTGSGEFAGCCFSPDGSTLFVNIQTPGMTLAITGPWNAVRI